MVKGIDLFRSAAEQGWAPSAGELAKLYGTTNEDHDLYIHWLEKAVRLGDVPSQTQLAWLLEGGRIVGKDLRKALSLYEDAANAGDYSASERLATLYYEGKKVARNHSKALSLYTKMAETYKSPVTLYRIGRLYYDGDVPHNCEGAINAFKMASDLGSAEAKSA